MLQNIIHYSLHFIAPGLIAYLCFQSQWKNAWIIMIATMLVDIDHLLATPIFDPNRCSIGFHPLHSYWAIIIYALTLALTKNQVLRIVCVGLLFHMLTDTIDCWFSHI